MPILSPFKAVLYGPQAEPSLVTAPPYDVISPSRRVELGQRDPRNIVHLTLPGEDYQGAAKLWNRWLREGTLVARESPSIFLYVVGPSAGIVCELELEPFGEAGVLPHENTMPGPKQDRLELMRTTRANLEPLWFFASSPVQGYQEVVDRTLQRDPLIDFTDSDGVDHKLFEVDLVEAGPTLEAMQRTTIVMGDGHHRYETAMTFRDEMRRSRGPGGWDRTLALIADPIHMPPDVRAIHRVVRNPPAGARPEDLGGRRFDGSLSDLSEGLKAGLVGLATPEGRFVVEVSSELDTLAVAEIAADLGEKIEYQHDLTELDRLVSDGAWGFVLAPVGIEVVAEFASRGQRMPPKTTLFGPKPYSGLVMRSLE